MILSLQTNTFGCYGGIPTYNKLVSRVLNAADLGSGNRVLVAMDDLSAIETAAASHQRLRISGFAGKRSAFVKAALSIVAREPVDLVLAGHVNYAPLCFLLKLLRPQMRYGVFIYGCEAWERIPLLRRWALQQADFVISISDYTNQQAVNTNRVKEERTFLLPNALEWSTNQATASPEVGSLPPGIKLLSVGRLDATERRKGFDTVIVSLPAIAREVPSVQYIIIGSGTDLERHRQLAREVGVSKRVHFLGNVNEATLRHCYESCDVFVMPSAQEGFGFVYLEAMQYSKPVVAAKCGGSPEVVEDSVTGLLTEYGNVAELSAVLTRLCSDPGLRGMLGSAGKQRLGERFTFAQFNETLVGILQKQMRSRELSDAVCVDSNPAR